MPAPPRGGRVMSPADRRPLFDYADMAEALVHGTRKVLDAVDDGHPLWPATSHLLGLLARCLERAASELAVVERAAE